MKLLRKISQLNPQEATILAKVLLHLIIFKVALLLLPFEYFKSFFKWISAFKNSKKNTTEYNHLVIKFTQSLGARLPLGFTCLPQAIAVKYLLRSDKKIVLKIGIIKNNTIFQSHAWLEKDGKILVGESSENYIPIWNWK